MRIFRPSPRRHSAAADGDGSAVGEQPPVEGYGGDQGEILFLVASVVVNFANFLIHVLVSRVLGPSTYGAVAALLNLVTIVSVPLVMLQAIVVQEVVARRFKPGAIVLRKLLLVVVAVGLVLTILVAATSSLVVGFLALSSVVPVLLLSLWLLPSAVTPIAAGVLIGRLRFRPLAMALVAGALCRLVVTAAAIELYPGITSAVVGTIVGAVLTAFLLLRSVRSDVVRKQGVPLTLSPSIVTRTVFALGGYSLLLGLDTILARHILAPQRAGDYAAAATAAKIALFLPGAMTTLMFPRFVADFRTGRSAKRNLLLTSAVVGAVGLLSAVVMFVAPDLIVRILFGRDYLPAAPLLQVLAFEGAVLGLVFVFTLYHLAHKSLVALAPWAASAVITLLVVYLHPSAIRLADTMLVVTCALLAVMAYAAFSAPPPAAPPPLGAIRRRSPGTLVAARTGEIDLTIVVPYYNPGPRLVPHVAELLEVLRDKDVTFEVLAVSDGSTDNSDELLEGLGPELRVFRLPANVGKGQALRVGLSEGRGEWLGFIDGDGDIPASVLARFVDHLLVEQPDVVIGSKRHPDSTVVYPPIRYFYSVAYQVLTRTLFGMNVSDTQTGVKLVRREAVMRLLPVLEETGFTFDLEVLALAWRIGYRRFVEMPVEIRERFSSSISAQTAFSMLLDTFGLWWRIRIRHSYDNVLRADADGRTVDEPTGLTEVVTAAASTPPAPESSLAVWRSVSRPIPPLPLPFSAPSKLRLLVCNWRDLHHPRAGGAEVWAAEVTKSWAAMGHDVVMFCASVDGCPETEVADGVTIVRRGTARSVYAEAEKYFTQAGTDAFDLVVDIVNTKPFGAPKWAGATPVLAVMFQVTQDVWYYELPLSAALIGRVALEPHWLKPYRDTPTVTISHSSRLSLEHKGIRKVTELPVGYRSGTPVNVPKETVPTVLYVGRLSRNKRPDEVLKAFALAHGVVPNSRLWVVGTGVMERELHRAAPPGVEFFGHVNNETKREMMARAHALVMTSVREGWGLTVTEAAEVGTPTIGYEVPGLVDSITVSGGWLVAPSVEPLAGAMTNLFQRVNTGRLQNRAAPSGVVSWDDLARYVLAAASFPGYVDGATSLPGTVVDPGAEPPPADPPIAPPDGGDDDRTGVPAALSGGFAATGIALPVEQPLPNASPRSPGRPARRPGRGTDRPPRAGRRSSRVERAGRPGQVHRLSARVAAATAAAWRGAVGHLSAFARRLGRVVRRSVGSLSDTAGVRRKLTVIGLVAILFTAVSGASGAVDTGSNLSSDFADLALACLFAAAVVAVFETRRTIRGSFQWSTALGSRRQWTIATATTGLVSAAVMQTWFRLGTEIASGDKIPLVGTAWVARMFSAYVYSGSDLGGINTTSEKLPLGALVWIVHAVGAPESIAQRLWFTLMFVGAALAMLWLARVIGLAPWAAVTAAIVYLLAQPVLTGVDINPVNLAELMLLPAYVATVLAVARGSLRLSIGIGLFVLSTPFIGYLFVTPPDEIVLAVAVGLAALLGWRLGGSEAGRRVLALLVLGGIGVLVAGAYWVVPALADLHNANASSFAPAASWLFTELRSSATNALWSNQAWGWHFSAYAPYASGYARFPLDLLRYGLVALAFSILLLPRVDTRASSARLRMAGFLILAAILILVLSTGTKPPGDLLFNVLYRLPLGWLLREPGRFLVVAAMAEAILAAMVIDAIVRGAVRLPSITALVARPTRRVLAALVLVGLVAVAPGFPIASGQIVASGTSGLPPERVVFPAYWNQMASVIDAQPAKGFVTVLPEDAFYQVSYSWGYHGSDGFIANLMSRPVIDPLPQTYYTSTQSLYRVVGSLSSALVAHDWALANDLLTSTRSQFLLVRGDVLPIPVWRHITPPEVLASALRADPDVRLVATRGPLELFETRATPGTGLVKLTSFATTYAKGPPDLRVLPLLPAGTQIIAHTRIAGVPIVDPVPGIGSWVLKHHTISYATSLPAGWNFRLAALQSQRVSSNLSDLSAVAPGLTTSTTPKQPISSSLSKSSATAVGHTTSTTGQLLTFSEQVGASALASTSPRNGGWGRAANCSGLHERQPFVSALSVPYRGPGGAALLTIEGEDAKACVSRRLVHSAGPVLVSLKARSISGPSPSLCVFEPILQQCASLPTLKATKAWTKYQVALDLPPGTSNRIYLYAPAGRLGTKTVVQFSDFSVRRLPSIPSALDLLGTPVKPSNNLAVWWSSVSAKSGWTISGDPHPVTVSGMASGWLLDTKASKPIMRYEWRRDLAAAKVLSFVGVVFGLVCLVFGLELSRRRRRGGGALAAPSVRPLPSYRRAGIALGSAAPTSPMGAVE